MTLFEQRGGAKVGWLNMSWPFARIEVSTGSIELSAMRRFRFEPRDVITLEKIGVVPLLHWGVRIHHTNPDYPERIVYFTRGSREEIIDAARIAGFTTEAQLPNARRGFPMRILSLLGVVVVWNALFLLDMNRATKDFSGPGLFSITALWLVFALAVSLPYSRLLHRVFLRPGRRIGEIQPVLKFIAWLTGGLGLAMSFMTLAGLISAT